jgi:ABC-type multidrug transport system fused ATPase/permease subunit
MSLHSLVIRGRRTRAAAASIRLGGCRFGTTALALIAAAGTAIMPVTIQQVVDRTMAMGREPRAGLVLAIAGIGTVGLLAATWCAYLLEARFVRRTELLLHIVRTQAFTHMVQHSGPPAPIRMARGRRAVADIDRVSHFVRFSGPGLVLNTGRLLVAAGVTAVYSWEIAVLTVAAMGTIITLQSIQWRRAGGAVQAVWRRERELRDAIVRLVLRAREFRAYEDRRRAQTRAEAAVSERARQERRLERSEAGSDGMHELGIGAVAAAVVFAGAYLGAHRAVTVGELAALLLALALSVAPMRAVIAAVREGWGLPARWRRLRQVCLRDFPATEPMGEQV